MSKSKTRKKINNYVLHLDQPLGSGSYATVYKCHDQQSNTTYAAKVVQRAKMQADEYAAKCIKLQMSIHQSLVHDNIVRIVDIIQTTNNYYIFQEYCSGGTLRALLQSEPQRRLYENDAVYCIKSICAAFQPMFEKGVIHRDLKPENIVIEDSVVKLTDFGFAKAMASSRQMTSTVIGTPLYMSPQILSKQPYTSKCDIWSVGVIFYEMLVGRHPWTGNGLYDLFNKISNNKQVYFPPDIQISEQSKSLIIQCLQFQESDRLSWIQLYQHEIWEGSFGKIAEDWRKGYEKAKKRIQQLRKNMVVEVLVGVFLRIRAPCLNFLQFYAIMCSLFDEQLNHKDAGMMYELFDKDSNGVIDLLEFVGYLSQCPEPILELLNKLVLAQHYYEQLSSPSRFKQLTKNEPQSISQAAFQIISSMIY